MFISPFSYCVPSMALILLVKAQSRVFTAKCSEPQVGISNGMDGVSVKELAVTTKLVNEIVRGWINYFRIGMMKQFMEEFVANSRLGWYRRSGMNVVNFIISKDLLEYGSMGGARNCSPSTLLWKMWNYVE